jgi:ApaG protein
VFSSQAETQGIRIQVQSFYVPERSDPEQGQWFFAYQVHISNVGTQTAQLVSRHWIITDADGHVEHVRGPGVEGEEFDAQIAPISLGQPDVIN